MTRHITGGATIDAQLAPGSKCGLLECRFGGLFTGSNVVQAQALAVGLMHFAPAALLRLDQGMFLTRELPQIDAERFAGLQTPAAFIVRPDQYVLWQDYAVRLAREAGLVRAVFLLDDLEAGARWAEDRAAVALLRSRQARAFQPRSGRAPGAGRTASQATAPPG